MFSKLMADVEKCEKALKALYINQTLAEIEAGATLIINDKGFSGSVSVKLTEIAEMLLNGEHFNKFQHSMVAATIATNWPQLIAKGF